MALLAGGCSPASQSSQPVNFPTQPITIIVPFAAGGSTDLMARAMEKSSTKYLGQQLIVKNVPGGSATIGWNELAGSKPDGYTIGVTANGLILQPLFGPTKFHYLTALEPLAQIANTPVVLAVKADAPWNTIQDLVKYAREHPGEVKYGHSGLGTSVHIVVELLAKEANIELSQVPFRGEAESIAALLGGHIQMMTGAPSGIKEHLKAGTVKVLAVSSSERMNDPVFAAAPTFREQGLNVTFDMWYGVAAPKGLPAPVKAKLAEGLKKMTDDPEFCKTIEGLGMSPNYLGPEQTTNVWLAENQRLSQFVKESGLAERIAKQKN